MPKPEAGIYILSGPIRSGKTTSLQQWTEDRKDMHGILTPVVSGQRFFMNVNTREQFPMEAGENETEVLNVGRFRFSKNGFEKAILLLQEARDQPGWLVIDEIGPLELRGEGFHDLLADLMAKRRTSILLVVREGFAEKVQEHFGFRAQLINSITHL